MYYQRKCTGGPRLANQLYCCSRKARRVLARLGMRIIEAFPQRVAQYYHHNFCENNQ
jgi:hypothetical protein